MKNKRILAIIVLCILIGYVAGYSHRSLSGTEYQFDEELFRSHMNLESTARDYFTLMNQLERIARAEQAYYTSSIYGEGDHMIYVFISSCRVEYESEVYQLIDEEEYEVSELANYVNDFKVIADIISDNPDIEYQEFKAMIEEDLRIFGKLLV